jgi:hypothetical protein
VVVTAEVEAAGSATVVVDVGADDSICSDAEHPASTTAAAATAPPNRTITTQT